MTDLPDHLALLTDLYELTMAASYFESDINDPATFSLFIRRYPPQRSYFVAAGLEDVLRATEDFHFSEADLSYLKDTGIFTPDFLDFLKTLQFTGTIRALPEGEIFFKDEPILEVTAPMIEAQILETMIINLVNLQTMIATKAARCMHAAAGRKLVDFSLRRVQGIDAGLKVARSSYITGFEGTSNVLAGQQFGIPISGTMAHSYVCAFGKETEAFRAFARTFPHSTVLLIDTYDTLEGARKAAMVGQEMAREGKKLLGVRLDSGEMAPLSREVRAILDEAKLNDVLIFASSSFDEYKIFDTVKEGGVIDAFGVGTHMGVSADAPYLDMVYKLVAYGERPILKLSPNKVTLAGEKQVFRKLDDSGMFSGDLICLKDETPENAMPLLETVLENGKAVRPHPSLEDIRQRFKRRFDKLNAPCKRLRNSEPYPVAVSPKLQALQEREIKRWRPPFA